MAREIQMPIGQPNFDPASPGAIENGCICDPARNQNGKGEPQPDGTIQFYPSLTCPIHGIDALRRGAKESDTE